MGDFVVDLVVVVDVGGGGGAAAAANRCAECEGREVPFSFFFLSRVSWWSVFSLSRFCRNTSEDTPLAAVTPPFPLLLPRQLAVSRARSADNPCLSTSSCCFWGVRLFFRPLNRLTVFCYFLCSMLALAAYVCLGRPSLLLAFRTQRARSTCLWYKRVSLFAPGLLPSAATDLPLV
ncbi:unnamed protein product [Ectocarpus sp. 13 AM-2016]